MKKQIVVIGMLTGLLFCSACMSPKKGEEKKSEDSSKGCGCESSENALDLRAATEKAGAGLASPTVKL